MSRPRLMLACIAVLCLALAPTRGADPDEQWRFKSAYYDITTDLERAQAKAVADHMDAVHAEYTRRFSGFNKRNAEPLRLWVFSTREAYGEFLESHGIDSAGSGGMFFRRDDAAGLVSFLGGRPMSSVLETLRHEGMHQFVYQRIGDDLPVWLNEGMAEWFGYAVPTGSGFAMGLADPRPIRRLQAAAAEGRLIPLTDLLTMTKEDWNNRVRSGAASLQYDEAWSVVQFLVYTEGGRYERLLMDMLRLLWSGVQPDRAVERCFGSDLAPMETAWKDSLLAFRPDELYEAQASLAAYARLLTALDALGVHPENSEQFDEALQEHAGSMSLPEAVETPLGERPLTIETGAWWRTPPTAQRTGLAATVRFTPDRRGELPPQIRLRGLKNHVSLSWSRPEDGVLSYEIEIH